ncbi:MAG: hypothetical protein JST61_08370 [Acidobacteria bacterium]|nr:hypothetical protein [Acidobacteriota bacterium]
MLSAARIVVSLVLGYAETVALAMVSTFALVHLRRDIVLDGRRLSMRYKLLQGVLWMVNSAIAGYLALLAAGNASHALTAALLAAALVVALWRNTEEARQTGLLYMLAASASIVAGVAVAYYARGLQMR